MCCVDKRTGLHFFVSYSTDFDAAGTAAKGASVLSLQKHSRRVFSNVLKFSGSQLETHAVAPTNLQIVMGCFAWPGMFVGDAGLKTWESYCGTWIRTYATLRRSNLCVSILHLHLQAA